MRDASLRLDSEPMRPGETRSVRVQIISTHHSPEQTGNAPYSARCATGLAERGFEVSVLAGAPHYPGWSVYPAEQWCADEVVSGVRVQRLTSYVPTRPSFLTRLLYETLHGVRFAQMLDREADALVLVSPSLFASVVVRLRTLMLRRRPAVLLWMQDLYSAGLSETPGIAAKCVGRVMRLVEGALARSCDTVVVIHERFRRFVVEELGADPSRVAVIRNWTHVQPPTGTRRAELRRAFGWDRSGDVVALHAGNMGEKQGLTNVVAAAQWAQAQGRPVRFVLMGDGNQRHLLEDLGKDCTHLQVLPPVDASDFVDVLAAADVLLVNERPTLCEAAVPSKLTSYFVTGRPVVAATAEGSATSDEIRASKAGRLVDPTDPSALVEAVEGIASDWTADDERRGPNFVSTALSESASLDAIASVIRTTLARRSCAISQESAPEVKENNLVS